MYEEEIFFQVDWKKSIVLKSLFQVENDDRLKFMSDILTIGYFNRLCKSSLYYFLSKLKLMDYASTAFDKPSPNSIPMTGPQ